MAWEIFGRSIKKIGVIGSGNIGPEIALYFSKIIHTHGAPVIVVDIAEEALKSGEARIKGKIVFARRGNLPWLKKKLFENQGKKIRIAFTLRTRFENGKEIARLELVDIKAK